jgi:hypothetical protein
MAQVFFLQVFFLFTGVFKKQLHSACELFSPLQRLGLCHMWGALVA